MRHIIITYFFHLFKLLCTELGLVNLTLLFSPFLGTSLFQIVLFVVKKIYFDNISVVNKICINAKPFLVLLKIKSMVS